MQSLALLQLPTYLMLQHVIPSCPVGREVKQIAKVKKVRPHKLYCKKKHHRTIGRVDQSTCCPFPVLFVKD